MNILWIEKAMEYQERIDTATGILDRMIRSVQDPVEQAELETLQGILRGRDEN